VARNLHTASGGNSEQADSNRWTEYLKDMNETTTLGGGCFWCLEAVYREISGVETVISGYAGGHVEEPTYEEVCDGSTNHAEVIRVEFDPEIISYGEILEVFFGVHDPTTLNQQGGDVGTQYRSVIYYETLEQGELAAEVIARLEAEGVFAQPIVTEVGPLDTFYPAETYHHDYYARNTGLRYCQVVIGPKIAKLRQRFAAKLKETAH